MANPTTTATSPIITMCRVVAAASASEIMYLNPDQEYWIRHNQKTEAGANNTDAVFFTTDGETPTASYAAGPNRGTLLSTDGIIPIGPGISKLRFISAGTPTFDVFPSGFWRGQRPSVNEAAA